jgi:hypothetical protein
MMRLVRRVLLLVSVVALILVMVAMSVAPAFAAGLNSVGCRGNDHLAIVGIGEGYGRIDENGDNFVCVHETPHGIRHAYDNQL